VGQGETVCLVGESGCGKTVSALSILGLLPQPPARVAGGTVTFKGQNLLDLGEQDLQQIRGQKISMVFQEPMSSLNPVFTIGDQIAEAIRTHETVSEEKIASRCLHLLENVGIPSAGERLGDYPHQLSGGQLQRVMIAMALACNPELIIADEPTGNLDSRNGRIVVDLLAELNRKWKRTVIIATHSSLADSLATIKINLKDGMIFDG